MKKLLPIALFVMALGSGLVQAHDLQVSVAKQQASVAADQDVEVVLNYRNTGKETLRIYKWYVPGQELQEQIFEVSRDGKPVSYLGPRYKRAVPTIKDTVALAPGASLSVKVKVSDYYDMSKSGRFDVRFQAASSRVLNRAAPQLNAKIASGADAAVVADEVLSSNTASVSVAGRRSKLLKQSLDAQREWSILSRKAAASSVTYAANCSVTQQSQTNGGVSAAINMANDSVSYLSGSPSGTPRYTTWFGKYALANWNTAKSHYVSIKDALDTKPISIDCGCTQAGTYAYVYPAQPYKIYLCGAFWNAPTSGTDSKGGTLVHELSHFTVVAGTDDHVYGQSGAKNLAKTNPAQALNNADNHEYFAENTPAQQ
ncbi:M35 family metallo-endopeptidase [Chromobacterium haemolyticum]|uniref:M35 family metallo-endopeptidase n=1 Tax=Chromobacterium haemolyticum TaxID=394935 RepID=UPI0009D93E2A|nr:M35 family metallo-endopeptidase [Chromobacterium haemolyticum]OQS41555.1 hypothetical protein B0T39_08970 [Chromobacterium haemolyticum]